MSKTSRLIVLCSAVLCSQYLCAQSRTMGIEEMFRLADENSKSIQTYRTGKEVSDENLKAAKAQRLPDISASLSGSYWGNGKLWDRDFSNATKIDMPHWGNNFALEAQQVVYAGGAISSGIELAELEKQLAEMDWQKNRQDIRFLLVGHYLNLYKLHNQIEVLHKNLELTDQLIANMQARLEEGTALENDISSLFKNNRKLKAARLNVRKAQETYELAQEQTNHAVQESYVNFLTSFTDLRTQQKSVELADQNYSVTSNRYQNDLALLTDMLDASNMKLSADLGLVNARINVIYNYYKMKYITHTL